MARLDDVFDEAFDEIDRQFPDFGVAELHEDEMAASDNGAGAERQYAYCKDGDPMIIAFASKAHRAPTERLKGLMRHEFGHALEYRFGVKELEKRLGRKLPAEVERRADAIAEAVWGEPIVYDEKLVQCVGREGIRPRPAHLPDEKAKLKANPAYPAGRVEVDEEDRLAGGPSVTFRFVEGGREQGYLVAVPEGPGRLQVEYVEVDEERRREGVATRLYEEALRYTSDRGLRLMSDTRREWEADHFWQKMRQMGKAERVFESDRVNYYIMKPGTRPPLPNPPSGQTFTAYHATTKGIPQAPTEFRSFRGMDYGPGFYLGTEPRDLDLYGDRLYEATVRMSKPLVISHEEPVDWALVNGLRRALRIDEDMLDDYPHPLVGIFSLANELYAIGSLRPESLIAALQKKGYDGVYVDGDIVNDHQDMGLRGDYLAIWSPEQIVSWEEKR